MAKKDWKRTRNVKTEITNDTLIFYENDFTGDHVTVASRNEKGNWFVAGRDFNSITFKSKSRAMKHANSYMRSH